jgi:regulator of sirC expression with transglutaminase-like and TPR domain
MKTSASARHAVDELIELLTRDAPGVNLDVAAAQVACIEFPGLDAAQVLDDLDRLAWSLDRVCPPSRPGEEFIAAANRFLFEELGFQGNEADYYNPRNSCLNEVLRRRLGIPITLSVVYMEVARRLHRPVYGIGLPGHFIVQFDDGAHQVLLDPFHAGRALTEEDCQDLIRERLGEAATRTSPFRRATKRQILTRMLQNLKSIYLQTRQFPKGLEVLNLLLRAYPDSADDLRLRGLVSLEMKRYAAAKTDLERFLELEPETADGDQIREQIGHLRRWSAQWN